MIRDFILEIFKFIGELNYGIVFLLSALESTCFPVLIPVETVIIPMGYYAYLGTKKLYILIFACTSGIVVGCLINYAFARFLGRTFIYKHSKLLHINIDKLKKLEKKFLSHGRLIIFIGRFIPIPAAKHIITIPAGMAKMPIFQFIFYNALGGFIFSTSMLLIGYFFGSSEELIHKAIGKFTIICVIVAFTYIIIKIIIKFIGVRTKYKNDKYGVLFENDIIENGISNTNNVRFKKRKRVFRFKTRFRYARKRFNRYRKLRK